MPPSTDPVVHHNAPMPPGYTLVRKGNIYLTKNCRGQTYKEKRIVYIEKTSRGHITGIRVPTSVFHAVMKAERDTRDDRKGAVVAKDERDKNKFELKLRELYPKFPEQQIPALLKSTLQKRTGRVGRSTTIGERNKVILAVTAYARHNFTKYDEYLRNEKDRDAARRKVRVDIQEVLCLWADNQPPEIEERSAGKKDQESQQKRQKKPGGAST